MILVTFYSTSCALLLDKALKKRGVVGRVIPVPRELSSSCGYAVEIETDDSAFVVALVSGEELEWEAVYEANDGYFLIELA